MNKYFEKYAKGIGISKERLKFFNSLDEEKLPEDLDKQIEEFVNEFKGVQLKVAENQIKDKYIPLDEMDLKFQVHKGSVAQKINKQFNLGLKSNDVREMDYEEVLKAAKEKIDSDIAKASESNDEELKIEVKKWQEEFTKQKELNEDLKSGFDAKYKELENEYTKKASLMLLENEFEKEFSKVEWGIRKQDVPLWKKEIKNTIMEKYDFKEGKLTGKNDTHAIDFEGNGIYDSLSQPINYLLEKNELVKKSHGGAAGAGGGALIGGGVVKDKLSDAAKNMMESFKQS